MKRAQNCLNIQQMRVCILQDWISISLVSSKKSHTIPNSLKLLQFFLQMLGMEFRCGHVNKKQYDKLSWFYQNSYFQNL